MEPFVRLKTPVEPADPAPTDKTGANSIDASGELNVNSGVAVDVYIQPVGADGSVRVDA